MTAEELSDARLGQIKELERDNTALRVRLLNMGAQGRHDRGRLNDRPRGG